jgi:hypothetical protein
MHLPTTNMPNAAAPDSRTAPMPWKSAPTATARGLPIRSANAPANKEATVAASSMQDTTMPRRVGGRSPKSDTKGGIVVTGLIMPVSRLWWQSVSNLMAEGGG